MKPNLKMNKSKILKILAFFLSVCTVILFMFLYSSINKDYKDYKEVDDTQEQIVDDVATTQADSTDEFNIDWNKLKSINKDIVAWIRIPDTDISYPVVQGKTNNQYLRKNIYGNYSRGGTPFVSAEQQVPFNCVNTIVYGHNLMDGKMFAQLKKYKNKNFASSHNIVLIYLPSGEIRQYQVYSFHTVSASDTEVYNLYSDSTSEYAKAMNKNNVLQMDIDINDNMQVLTLSTCTNNGDSRYVLHAVYIKNKNGHLSELERNNYE